MYKKMVPADVYARRIAFGRPACQAHSMMRKNQMDASEMLNRPPQDNAVKLCKEREDQCPCRPRERDAGWSRRMPTSTPVASRLLLSDCLREGG